MKMIVYPKNWNREYEKFADVDSQTWNIEGLIELIKGKLIQMKVISLAYSGGIDSTIILALMNQIFGTVRTFTISSRATHPDIKYARMGSEIYKSEHTEIIIESKDEFSRKDSAYRIFFEQIKDIDSIICCDGIDEFMCGYYDHLDCDKKTYKRYLEALTSAHLMPLDVISGDIEVYLPYLDENVINTFAKIPFENKVSQTERKKVVIEMAGFLNIDIEIISRNKYGFCDAFLSEDK